MVYKIPNQKLIKSNQIKKRLNTKINTWGKLNKQENKQTKETAPDHCT